MQGWWAPCFLAAYEVIVFAARGRGTERTTKENGGPRGGAGRRQLPDGHGEEQVHAGGSCEQKDSPARSQVRKRTERIVYGTAF
ncbi:hypothetical protein KM043_015215 [Ampulex compressa]|nr:hypothetical protein KM043_015215 [Ampulex compressa]